ncbi:MAG: protein kinase [Ignavibacteriaceae bacterium]|nr:protein kinase [Ignavibacteriaceae bacterium]
MINNRYIIHKKIGEGRSSVYLCKDVEYPQRSTAIKILNADSSPDDLAAFQKEFFTIKKFSNPFIVKAYDFGKILSFDSTLIKISIGSFFFTMEYFEGKPLSDFTNLSEETLINITAGLCRVLYYLHQSNYIYYDLKPENILVQTSKQNVKIKLIDFGLIENQFSGNIVPPRGSLQYIAPEILKNQKASPVVDLYSLGIILYFIVYKSYPFETDNVLSIYKAHIEKEFVFPPSDEYPNLVKIIPQLLEKFPFDRHNNALEVVDELGIILSENETAEFTPAKCFAGRGDAVKILKKFIDDKKSDEVFAIVGAEGAGKSTIGEELTIEVENFISLYSGASKSGADYFDYLLRILCSNPAVHIHLTDKLSQGITNLRKDDGGNYIDKLKIIFNQITSASSFILFLDDFNRYDTFVIEVYKQLIPLIQLSSCKLILTLDSDKYFSPDYIFNLREVNLTPFTDTQLEEYLQKSYSPDFPVDELKHLILLYADLLPGNIGLFIKDALLFGLIQYQRGKAIIDLNDEKLTLIKRSHEDIYKYRLTSLLNDELLVAKYISCFNNNADTKIISRLLGISLSKLNTIVVSLIHKNILSPESEGGRLIFSSEGFKKFTYSVVAQKQKWHAEIAKLIDKEFAEINRNELAFHYESANDYLSAANVYFVEISAAETLAAYAYSRKILEHMLTFPLPKNLITDIKISLVFTLHKLGESKPCLLLLDEIDTADFDKEKQNKLLIAKADGLVDSGEIYEGLKYFNFLLNDDNPEDFKTTVLIKTARANIDLSAYDESIKICSEIISSNTASHEHLAQCHNILGLAAFYKDENLNDALLKFGTALNYYKKADNKLGISQMYLNEGNIYNVQKLHEKAKESWEKALDINHSIGNLDQEAKLLMNFGIFHYEHLEFDEAIESYKRAVVIFVSLGNKNGEGMVLTNLGEIYLFICEYQKAFDCLSGAEKIFGQISNTNEGLEALFLLAKLYFVIGDTERLKNTITDFQNKTIEENRADKFKLNRIQLNLYSDIINNIEVSKDILISSRKTYFEKKKPYNFLDNTIRLANFYISQNNQQQAFNILNEPEVNEICKQNPYLSAERDYALGVVCKNSEDLRFGSAIDYCLSAYNTIKDLNITELTWHILFELCQHYFNRGMIRDAAEFINYTRTLILQTGDNLKDSQLKNSYLQDVNRRLTLEKLDYLERHLQ